MDIWILTALFLRPKLAYAAKVFEQRAMDEALDLKGDALEVCEKVMELNDVRRRLINLKVICDRIEEAMSKEEYLLLKEYVTQGTGAIALKAGCTRMRVYRAVKRALYKAVQKLNALGFDSQRMNDDYLSVPLCRQAYKKIVRLKSRAEDLNRRHILTGSVAGAVINSAYAQTNCSAKV